MMFSTYSSRGGRQRASIFNGQEHCRQFVSFIIPAPHTREEGNRGALWYASLRNSLYADVCTELDWDGEEG